MITHPREHSQASVGRASRQDFDPFCSAQEDSSLASANSDGQTCHAGVPRTGQLPLQWLLRSQAKLTGDPAGIKGRGWQGSRRRWVFYIESPCVEWDWGTGSVVASEPSHSARGQARVRPLCSYQMCALLCKGKDMPDAEGSVALMGPNLWTKKTSFILGIKYSTSQGRAAVGYCGLEAPPVPALIRDGKVRQFLKPVVCPWIRDPRIC